MAQSIIQVVVLEIVKMSSKLHCKYNECISLIIQNEFNLNQSCSMIIIIMIIIIYALFGINAPKGANKTHITLIISYTSIYLIFDAFGGCSSRLSGSELFACFHGITVSIIGWKFYYLPLFPKFDSFLCKISYIHSQCGNMNII